MTDPRRPPDSTQFTAQFDRARALDLAGDCRDGRRAGARARARAVRAAPPGRAAGRPRRPAAFDIGPAWLLHGAGRRPARGRGAASSSTARAPRHFAYFDELRAREAGALPARAGAPLADLAGRPSAAASQPARSRAGTRRSCSAAGCSRAPALAWRSLKRLRVPSVVRHMHETGVQAIPIVAVIALLISVISAYIGAQQLRPFGAEIYTVDLVAIGVLRELGVLLTAIMVAGRTGSAYAAELGVMKLNDEVDALESMGMNPYEVLVLPRVVALVLVMPLLTVVADAMGLAGGALLTSYLIDLPWSQFVMRLDSSIADTTFWAGLVKAPVFGLLIALTGTLRGLQVRESSRELGRLTTVAVVQSIFLVIFADALFAIFFLEIDF